MILISGAAGFIGFHLAKRLLSEGKEICAIDNMNTYYDVQLKEARLGILSREKGFHFLRADLTDRKELGSFFEKFRPDHVVHLAAQAGVRYSLINPYSYIDSNMMGFLAMLECCRLHRVKHLVYASSSSVYGGNSTTPFTEHQRVDKPVSLYAATKKANELMAYTYSHLYGLPCTGLRFFTAYGPFGRPDMAYFSFTKSIIEGRPIDVYNFGKMKRDFTYIDDIIEGVVRILSRAPESGSRVAPAALAAATPEPPYKIYNIGNNKPVELEVLIRTIERCVGRKATLNFMPMQPGEVVETYADIAELEHVVGFRPVTDLDQGIAQFVEWFREFYNHPVSMTG